MDKRLNLTGALLLALLALSLGCRTTPAPLPASAEDRADARRIFAALPTGPG